MKEGDIELLTGLVKFENSADMEKEYRIGWSWRHVRIWPSTLSRLFKDGYLENVFRSNSYTGYRLSEAAKELMAGGGSEEIDQTTNEPIPTGGLFVDIVGHDDVKELLTACLLAEKPVHVLLAGPPALAKSLFLWDIEPVAAQEPEPETIEENPGEEEPGSSLEEEAAQAEQKTGGGTPES